MAKELATLSYNEEFSSDNVSAVKEPPKPKASELVTLDPDNPLLEKFQEALKGYLLRQIDRLKEDIFQYECGKKKNDAKREELGVMVYEQQQVLEKQQKAVNDCIDKVQTTTAACNEVEIILAEKKEVYKQEREKCLHAETKEIELRKEIEGVNFLITQISKYETALESDISVKKRIFAKSRKDKQKLLEEKKQQDALIYKLMRRIWSVEEELEKMEMQMRVKAEEREEMAKTVAAGNINIEVLQAEYRSLMHSWNSVVVAIGNRDKVINCLQGELRKHEERFKTILTEIEQVKKLCQKQMKRNEEMTMMKTRFDADIQSCKTAIEAEFEKKSAMEAQINGMHAIIDQTEEDIHKLKLEMADTNYYLSSLQKEEQDLDILKGELEEKLFKEMEEEETNSKTLASLQRALKLLKTKNRELEIQGAQIENKIAGVTSDIEAQKFLNYESNRYLHELEGQLTELGQKADRHQEDLKQIHLKIIKKQQEVDFLNSKYQKLMEKSGLTYMSPMEMKINTLEKNIEETIEQNTSLQQFWLREQSNLIRIAEERQEQIQNNNLIQILILEQKNLKVTDDLEAHQKQQDGIQRIIKNFHNQLTVMGDTFVKTKGLKINMDKDYEVLKQDNLYKLKDNELEILKLEEEITQIEEDKVTLSEELIEANRQALEWEKKFIHAKETKSNMIEEQSKEGEVGTMKAEIHRMNVRYSHLKKVQDVLIQDLQHCVSRRDAIVTVSEAREKRTKGGMEKTRVNFLRKLDDMRNKLKTLENQIEQLHQQFQDCETREASIVLQMREVKFDIELAQEMCEETKTRLEELKTERQMNFELLIQIQKKLSVYTDLSKGRQPHLVYKSQEVLATQYQEKINLNSKLCKIVENLQGDFPNHMHELNRILNTLKLPVYVYYQ